MSCVYQRSISASRGSDVALLYIYRGATIYSTLGSRALLDLAGGIVERYACGRAAAGIAEAVSQRCLVCIVEVRAHLSDQHGLLVRSEIMGRKFASLIT